MAAPVGLSPDAVVVIGHPAVGGPLDVARLPIGPAGRRLALNVAKGIGPVVYLVVAASIGDTVAVIVVEVAVARLGRRHPGPPSPAVGRRACHGVGPGLDHAEPLAVAGAAAEVGQLPALTRSVLLSMASAPATWPLAVVAPLVGEAPPAPLAAVVDSRVAIKPTTPAGRSPAPAIVEAVVGPRLPPAPPDGLLTAVGPPRPRASIGRPTTAVRWQTAGPPQAFLAVLAPLPAPTARPDGLA